MCCARCCSRPRTWRWCVATPGTAPLPRRLGHDPAARGSPAVRADYEKVLRQRTALLKTAAAARYPRATAGALDTLDVWDGHLAAHGAQLMAARIELVSELAPEVEKAYQLLAPCVAAGGDPATAAASSGSSRAARRPRSCSRRRCWTRWPVGATPNSSAASVWSVRTATIWSCGSAINPRKALPATGNRGRWRWRCGWPPTNCCVPKAATGTAARRCVRRTGHRAPRRRWPASRPLRNRFW